MKSDTNTNEQESTMNETPNTNEQESTVTKAPAIIHIRPEFPQHPGDDVEFTFVPNMEVESPRAFVAAVNSAIDMLNRVVAESDPGTGIVLQQISSGESDTLHIDLCCPSNKKRRGVSLGQAYDIVCRAIVLHVTGEEFDKHPTWLIEAASHAIATFLSNEVPSLLETSEAAFVVADKMSEVTQASLDALSAAMSAEFQKQVRVIAESRGVGEGPLVEAMLNEVVVRLAPKFMSNLPDAADIETAFLRVAEG